MGEFRRQLAASIVYFRTLRDMSQSDLADALGVSRQTLSAWENARGNIGLDQIEAVAEKLTVSDLELVGKAGVTREELPPDVLRVARALAALEQDKRTPILNLITTRLNNPVKPRDGIRKKRKLVE